MAPTIHTSSFVLFPLVVPLVPLVSVMSVSLSAPDGTGDGRPSDDTQCHDYRLALTTQRDITC
ncbi:hypothetical protein SLI_0288 [Streptomyces lividans 1326]|uniref:Uncharacterized protein n=1 Tax=Streptomyces lividans 1326 TaxID=1200984 RepID=A0A7U9DNV4_STRLI|nr:hypothetical protein SLI_0288 [Streptomyces lividans 1326]